MNKKKMFSAASSTGNGLVDIQNPGSCVKARQSPSEGERKSNMFKKMISFAAVAGLVFALALFGGSASAALTTTVTNPGFDVPDTSGWNQTVPNWDEYSSYVDGVGYWGEEFSGSPTFTTPDQAASLIFTAVSQDAWLFQSLGLVDASDVGKPFALTADFGARTGGDGIKLSTVNMTVAFRSGTTTGGTLGTVLGTADTQTLSYQSTALQMATQTATFTPAAGDIGTEVFAVLDMDPQSMSGSSTSPSRHWMADSVTLTVVPEPATMSLLALGGLGVLLKRRRRRA